MIELPVVFAILMFSLAVTAAQLWRASRTPLQIRRELTHRYRCLSGSAPN